MNESLILIACGGFIIGWNIRPNIVSIIVTMIGVVILEIGVMIK